MTVAENRADYYKNCLIDGCGDECEGGCGCSCVDDDDDGDNDGDDGDDDDDGVVRIFSVPISCVLCLASSCLCSGLDSGGKNHCCLDDGGDDEGEGCGGCGGSVDDDGGDVDDDGDVGIPSADAHMRNTACHCEIGYA